MGNGSRLQEGVTQTFAVWPLIVCAFIAFALAFLLSGRLARRIVLADAPNERSSHQAPTSRAGGIAIISAWSIGLVCLLMMGIISSIDVGKVLMVFLLAACAAGFGIADDRAGLGPAAKFVGQFFPAIICVAAVGVFDHLPVPGFGEVAIGALAYPLTLLWIVGMMNVYNFMDGVNGLAGSCGALALIVIALVGVAVGNVLVASGALLLAGALAGFLPANLWRGNIFMGDGGSQPIGFLIATFGILLAATPPEALAVGQRPVSMLLVPVIMLPFIVDVGFTLIARAIRQQNVLQAHREHVYQLLLRQGLSHGEVTAIYLGMVSITASTGIALLFLPTHWQVAAVLFCITVISIFAMQVNIAANQKGLLAKPTLDGDLTGHSQPAE